MRQLCRHQQTKVQLLLLLVVVAADFAARSDRPPSVDLGQDNSTEYTTTTNRTPAQLIVLVVVLVVNLGTPLAVSWAVSC